MDKKSHNIYALISVFVISVVLAFYFEEFYRSTVRFFYKYLSDNKIQFVGKNFNFFINYYFLLSFGLYCVLFVKSINKKSKEIFLRIFISVFLFLISTILISYIDSVLKIVECTACDDGIRKLNYNEINYNFNFIFSIIIALLPILISKIRNLKSKI